MHMRSVRVWPLFRQACTPFPSIPPPSLPHVVTLSNSPESSDTQEAKLSSSHREQLLWYIQVPLLASQLVAAVELKYAFLVCTQATTTSEVTMTDLLLSLDSLSVQLVVQIVKRAAQCKCNLMQHARIGRHRRNNLHGKSLMPAPLGKQPRPLIDQGRNTLPGQHLRSPRPQL